jgi:hypothetical protein
MPKLNYYIYNPKWKLWTDINDFRNDYRAWIDCSGHWGNLPQRSEGVRSGLQDSPVGSDDNGDEEE